MRLLLTLGLATLLSTVSMQAAEAKAKHHGGKNSHRSEKKVAFGRAFNTMGQIIQANTPTAIVFLFDHSLSPKKVTHPFAEDFSKFAVHSDGAYLIGWTLTATRLSSTPTISIQPFNLTTSSPIGPQPFQQYKLEAGFDEVGTLSGQTIIHLEKETVLQLLLTTNFPLEVRDSTFFITRISK